MLATQVLWLLIGRMHGDSEDDQSRPAYRQVKLEFCSLSLSFQEARERLPSTHAISNLALVLDLVAVGGEQR